MHTCNKLIACWPKAWAVPQASNKLCTQILIMYKLIRNSIGVMSHYLGLRTEHFNSIPKFEPNPEITESRTRHARGLLKTTIPLHIWRGWFNAGLLILVYQILKAWWLKCLNKELEQKKMFIYFFNPLKLAPK